jgi:hypothetical protein
VAKASENVGSVGIENFAQGGVKVGSSHAEPRGEAGGFSLCLIP